MNIINYYGYPGIGDLIWGLMYIYPNIKNDMNIHIYSSKSNTGRSKFLNNLDRVIKVSEFRPPGTLTSIFDSKRNSYIDLDNLNDVNDIYLGLNKFLESGKRIEQFLPKLKVTFDLPWNEDQCMKNEAIKYGTNSIIIYTSKVTNNNTKPIIVTNNKNCKTNSIYSTWCKEDWLNLVKNIQLTYPNKQLIWIGASYDTSMKDYLIQNGIKNVKYFIDYPATFIIPLLRSCDAFISYQSGLSVISVLEKTPSFMVYFNILSNLRYSWCPPESIDNKKLYNPVLFDDISKNPDLPLEWLDSVIQHKEY